MPSQEFYAVEYSGGFDDHGLREYTIDVEEGLFASKEAAQRHADHLNAVIQAQNENRLESYYARAMIDYQRRVAEHEALAKAGLRAGPCRERPPRRWAPGQSQGVWRVSQPLKVRDEAPAAEVS